MANIAEPPPVVEAHLREPESASATYRPHLDGLRTVAVYLVVLFHAGIGRFSGGFIGVDVFFVLSGYLVTQLLTRDVHREGSLDLRRFYSRRVRRLLPASAVLLVATAAVYPLLAGPVAAEDAVRPLQASAMYFANWSLIAQAQDYFAPAVDQSPVLHFWSLAVEEQFYIVWPLAFAGLFVLARRAGARQWSVMRAVVGAGIVVSAAAAVWIARTDATRAYYGTGTRAYQLLAGALVALSPGLVELIRRSGLSERILGFCSACGVIGLVVVSVTVPGVSGVHRGLIVTLVTVALLVSLEAGGPSIAKRGLSLAPMVYLGRISYGTYLWHWIIIVALVNKFDLSAIAIAAITIVLATGVASLSYQMLEMPVRRWDRLDRHRTGVIVTGLALSLALGLVVLPRILERSGSTNPTGQLESTDGAGAATSVADVDWRFARGDAYPFSDCAAEGPTSCIVHRGSGPTVLLLGDSHALALAPMVIELAEARDLTLAVVTSPGCPWADGLLDQDPRAGGCAGRRADWYDEIIPAIDPELVILAERPIDDPTNSIALRDVEAGDLPIGSEKLSTAVERRSRATVDLLVGQGRKVVILEPIPVGPEGSDPITCLAEAEALEECRFVSHTDPTPVERIYRALDEDSADVATADLDLLVCPYLPICDPLSGRTVVFRDDIHLTRTFAASLSTRFGDYLDEVGFLPR